MTDTNNLLRIEPQPWMADPTTLGVLEALAAGGVEARFVGGSVRDALLGRPIGDIDIATPAPPERVIELLEKRGIKVVPTGLAHGTVTAIAGTPPRHFEITTLRRDVETYGRRARVAFDADWAADAARRDFTINAIFLDPDGTVHDPVGGLADLRARRVRFVGDPATRIAEDVLRILRYYRFEARFGTGLGDLPARAACRAMAHLLPNLSAERVAQELVKLLETLDPVACLADDGGRRRALGGPAGGASARSAAAYDRDRAGTRSAAAPGCADRGRRTGSRSRSRSACISRMRGAIGSTVLLRHGPSTRRPTLPLSGALSTGSAPNVIATSPCYWRRKGR